jgi:hypothetical protein
MDVSTRADRLRGMLNAPAVSVSARTAMRVAPGVSPTPIDDVLDGEWRDDDGHRCLVVERKVVADVTHGDVRVGDLAGQMRHAGVAASLVAFGALPRPPFLFFDLETTGLSGGAGTQAFLVGCAWFDDEDAFVMRQYVLARYADERPLLGAVAAEFAQAGALVSFNGKSFDLPILETRYLFHRLDWSGPQMPHIDVLHPARRFWRAGKTGAGEENEAAGCSLLVLERQVLGARRIGDVPGSEIPARYFQFVRTGDARPLAGVLEHNRLDLLSLAGLTGRLLHLVAVGPDEARDAREALALGRVYARGGLDERARQAWERAVEMSSGGAQAPRSASMALLEIDALRALAIGWRRAHRHDEAAACWQRLLDVHRCPRRVWREATEALAIHHEHRMRDLAAAKTFALRSLERGREPAWAGSTRHRLARIERKMAGATGVNGRGATLNLE